MDTQDLLEECNSGCKMAVESMDQVSEFVDDEALENLISKYKKKHEKLEKDSKEMLQEFGSEGKEPGMAASAFSWMSTEVKLLLKDNRQQAAKILMDGCNMGIQSISEDLNKYRDSTQESKYLAKELIRTEEEFMTNLKAFL